MILHMFYQRVRYNAFDKMQSPFIVAFSKNMSQHNVNHVEEAGFDLFLPRQFKVNQFEKSVNQFINKTVDKLIEQLSQQEFKSNRPSGEEESKESSQQSRKSLQSKTPFSFQNQLNHQGSFTSKVSLLKSAQVSFSK